MVYKRDPFKGKYGKKLEKWILKERYNVNYEPNNNIYDLALKFNKLTRRNVSIKSTKSNFIYCGDIFNFLNSSLLELIVIKYTTPINSLVYIKHIYLFENLDKFLIDLLLNLDLQKLHKLFNYIKRLKYPFSKKQRNYAHKLAKLVIKKDLCNFRVNCKLSSTNKRIQCSLKLDLLIKDLNPKIIYKYFKILF